MGKLQLMPGCDEEQSLEHEILGVLNQIRTTASEVTFHPSLAWPWKHAHMFISPVLAMLGGAAQPRFSTEGRVLAVFCDV